MTRFTSDLRIAAASLAITAALWQQPALAETWEIVAPPNMSRGDELKAEIWDFFLRGMAPGDTLTLHDGLHPRELSRIEIPDDPRHEEERFRTKALARETALLSRRIDALGGAGSGEFRYRIAFPEFAFAYANARTGAESHMLVITSGLHHSALEPRFSIRHRGGELVLPNDAHIGAPLSASPYGTRDRGESLKGVVAHFCLMAGDSPMTTHQKDELRRFWSLYVAGLGGEMATFTESLSGCFDRWRGKIRGGPPMEALDASDVVMGMRNVTRTPKPKREQGPRPRADARSGLEDFSLFSSNPHPALEGVEVMTGVKYRLDEYPKTYVRAWCYAMVEHRGAAVRIPIGKKVPLKSVEWATATRGTLAAAGISGADAEAGRPACAFPEDGA